MTSKSNLFLILVSLFLCLFFIHQEETYKNKIEELSIKNDTLQVQLYKERMKPPEIIRAQPMGIHKEDVDLLARLVHVEAGGESYDTKLKVASVVVNRLNDYRFPKTLQEVVYQEGQFAVTTTYTDGVLMINKEPDNASVRAAIRVLSEGVVLPSEVLVFYAKGESDDWVNSREVYEEQDNTVFSYL